MSKKSLNKVIFDTNIYIDFLNQSKYSDRIYNPDYLVYLSSVVLMELFAGSSVKEEIRDLEKLCKLYKRKNKLIVPSVEDYIEAGKIAAKMIANLGYDLKKSYWLLNDILIALSSQRIGAIVITQNRKDFEAIKKFKKISFIAI